MGKVLKFFKEEDGMELSEYAVVGGLLLVGAVAIITVWGTNIATTFGLIRDAVGTTGTP
jgi:Flp pilus assembly pilin Flp